jgi:hypothetical protein
MKQVTLGSLQIGAEFKNSELPGFCWYKILSKESNGTITASVVSGPNAGFVAPGFDVSDQVFIDEPSEKPKFSIRVSETNRKSARFFYEVLDQDGQVVDTRRTNRVYCACEIFFNSSKPYAGSWFGRPDLIRTSQPVAFVVQ